MPIKQFESAEEEMMEYSRMYVDGMDQRNRYDPAKAKAYYRRNREAILEMNKRYYANHRREYIDYLRSYWGANRELLAKRYKLRDKVQKNTVEHDTRSEWAIEREVFVNEVVPDVETIPIPPDVFTERQSRIRKSRAKANTVKPYTCVIRNEPFIMEFK
jgi:hypothetical protein